VEGEAGGAAAMVFLLAPPRAGSTLLQRCLGAADEVATNPETWFVPALLAPFGSDLIQAEFGWDRVRGGLRPFACGDAGLPTALLRTAARHITDTAPAGARYVVEKTPRNCLHLSAIAAAFPAAPLIVLVRDPVACIESALRSWRRGQLFPLNNTDNIVDAFRALADFVRTSDPSRSCVVRYEDLVRDPRRELTRVEQHLGLPDGALGRSLVPEGDLQVAGSTRTRLGTAPDIVDDSESARPASAFRRWYYRRVLERVGEQQLAVFGYSSEEAIARLGRHLRPVGSLVDLLALASSWIVRLVDPRLQVRRLSTGGWRPRLLS
jgi:hypothetical protein